MPKAWNARGAENMIADSYYKTRHEADQEVRRRRRDPNAKGMITKVSPSAYGGFRVHSVSAELMVDCLADGLPLVPERSAAGRYGAR